jgi:hypothetical protein
LTVTEYTNDINVYVSVIPSDVPRNKWEYPTINTKGVINSYDHLGIEVIYLTENDLRACENGCTILIGLKTNHNLETKGLASSYLITASRGIQTLINGVNVPGSMKNSGYRYYKFQKSCKECEIAIAFHPERGQSATIFVSFN